MSLLVKQARIIDPKSPFHDTVNDLLIENGKISDIAKNITPPKNTATLELDNLHVSAGWFDSSVSFGEPGYEDRESISNGLLVAASSGFTDIALQPNTQPVTDNQSQVYFLKEKARTATAVLHPIGALTQKSEGRDLAELFDMKNAGAVAFGDYGQQLEANLLKIALQYVQDFDGLVIAFSQESSLRGNGVANEGLAATRLGLKGIPNLAEELAIARNLQLLEYTGGKMHIPTLSCAKSVQLLKEAKAKGLQVSCSVSVHHLLLTDEKLEDFDTRYKIAPPLRTDSDRKALLKGLKDGTIDCITTDHNPIDIEHKKMEFDLAKSGTIGLESAFGALNTLLPLDLIIEKLTAAREIFGLEPHGIDIGKTACITFFNPENQWVFQKEHIRSKSKNSAFLGAKLKGKAYGIYANQKLHIS